MSREGAASCHWGSDPQTQSLANPGLELVDLFSDGTSDILQMNGSHRYRRNLGDGRFDLPRPMTEAPGGLSLADPGVQLIDSKWRRPRRPRRQFALLTGHRNCAPVLYSGS